MTTLNFRNRGPDPEPAWDEDAEEENVGVDYDAFIAGFDSWVRGVANEGFRRRERAAWLEAKIQAEIDQLVEDGLLVQVESEPMRYRRSPTATGEVILLWMRPWDRREWGTD